MPLRPEDALGAHVASVLQPHYEVDSEVGRGGMGIVYCARDVRLKRNVAIKLLPPELAFRADIRSRFLREAETAAQLSHPNIVPIYNVEERDNLVFFIMAFIAGDNLATRLQQQGAMDPGDVRRILREVADALGYAHKRNVVHRDIKPDNILLDADTGRAMVTDFGIARALTDTGDSRLTATGMAIGTPAYMSPEQSAGESNIDGRSDLYSLGVVGYQMACGDLPFNAPNTPSMLVKHLSERPTPVDERQPDLPMDLARVIMLMLEKDPANRFPDAESVVVALSSGVMPTLRTAQAPASAMPIGLSRYGSSPSTIARGAPVTRTGGGFRSPSVPSPEDLDRWNAEPVRKFRKKLAPYLAVNAILVPLSIFGDGGFLAVTGFWSIFLAVQYSKLWQDGYNWRDVFRQPRDRLIFDVAAETIDDARALFDETKREQVRARARARASGGLFEDRPRGAIAGASTTRGRMPRSPLPGESNPPPPLPADNSPYGSAMASIRMDRDEIQRQLLGMTKDERQQIPDVGQSADAIYRKAMQVATTLAELDLRDSRDTPEGIEKEIEMLEAQANPLDYRASEERVRRLAHLKRQRRVVADLSKRRSESETKLEHCRQLLRSMRLELLRYRSAGMPGASNGLTMVTQQAQVVVKEMGYLSDAQAEVNAL
ncbi:MAG TPA: protein kinase [Gemmatimonadaceae bacterium]|nr:protein kinase [Gemmatimonadaceae bacterium]